MRTPVLLAAVMAATFLQTNVVRAQSETDRLREALRSATAQMRALEDQRNTLQAQVSVSKQEQDRLKREVDAAGARVKEVERAHRTAITEFNQRLEERNEVLEKWRSAYEEAATVARTKDAERLKFETEAKTFRASTKSCAARNIQLVKVGNELIARLEGVHFGHVLAAQEPLIGFKRVEIQNLLQDYQDKILEQRATP